MKKIVFASTRKGAGKTSLMVGIAMAGKLNIGYIKPFGDRLLYKKKRLWDYDAALVTNTFGLTENAEDISIGFEHSKLRFMYDEAQTADKLNEMAKRAGNGHDVLFIEGGADLLYGASVHLDAMRVAKDLKAKVVIVVGGDESEITDDIYFLKEYGIQKHLDLAGVIINKVNDLEDFKATHMGLIARTGIKVLGVMPFVPELTNTTVGHIADELFAKVICGETASANIVKNIFVGAMSADSAMSNPIFKKEDKLIITSGDRSDMILTAIETNSAGIILTNNILPSPNITSRAAEKNIPVYLVPVDTYQAAKQIDNIEPLLRNGDKERLGLLRSLVCKHILFKEIA